jgi:hypothetical protein
MAVRNVLESNETKLVGLKLVASQLEEQIFPPINQGLIINHTVQALIIRHSHINPNATNLLLTL